MKKTKKDTTINLRLPCETKELLSTLAENNGISKSEYIRLLIEKDAETVGNNQIIKRDKQHGLSHEQVIINSLSENHFINTLLTNKEFSNKSKAIIGREIRKYV